MSTILQRIKYARDFVQAGGVLLTKIKELDSNKRFCNKNVVIVNGGDITTKLAKTLRDEGANVQTLFVGLNVGEIQKTFYQFLSNESIDIFINFDNIDYSAIADNNLYKVDETVLKPLFFILQEELHYFENGHLNAKILNLSNCYEDAEENTRYIASNGLKGLTQGIAQRLAPRNTTVNSITFDNYHNREDNVIGTTLFLASDCANNLLGQIIKINN